jgi:hypothetical protein
MTFGTNCLGEYQVVHWKDWKSSWTPKRLIRSNRQLWVSILLLPTNKNFRSFHMMGTCFHQVLPGAQKLSIIVQIPSCTLPMFLQCTNNTNHVLYKHQAARPIAKLFHSTNKLPTTATMWRFTKTTSPNRHYAALHKSPGYVTLSPDFQQSPLCSASQFTWLCGHVTLFYTI